MVKIQAEANVPTEYGKFKIIAFSEKEQDWMPHLALIAENTDLSSVVNVRFHSECITGEVFPLPFPFMGDIIPKSFEQNLNMLYYFFLLTTSGTSICCSFS